MALNSDDTVTVTLKLKDAAKFYAEAKLAEKGIDGISRAAKRGKKEAEGFSDAWKPLGGGAGRLALVAAGIGLVGVALPILTQALGAGSLAIVAFVSALVPAAGALAAIPAAALIAAQGLGVFKLATQGVGKAIGGLDGTHSRKAFDKLTPAAQQFVLAIQSLKPQIRGLRASLQAGLFPGMLLGLQRARPAIAALTPALVGTARVLGGFVAHLGALVGSKGFLADLASQARFNNVQLRVLGGAGLHVVNILRNLIVGSRGLVAWLVKLAAGWAATADRALQAWRANGQLTHTFHTVRLTIGRVLGILWSLGVALWNIGRIGRQQIGDGMLVHLLRATRQLERWTQSKHGIDQITHAFIRAREVLKNIGDWLHRAGAAIGPVLGDALKNLAAALRPLLASSGGPAVLFLYVKALSWLGRTVKWIEDNVPGATFALSALIALFVVSKFGGIWDLGKGMWALGKAAKKADWSMKALRESTFVTRIELAALKVQAIAATAVTWIMTAATSAFSTAFWALNAAMDANPIGLIILAIAAVAAGLYLAYKKIGWFHRAVDNVFHFIKAHWPLLLAILTGPFGLMVLFIVKHFGAVKGLVMGIVNFLIDRLNNVIDIINVAIKAFNLLPGPDIKPIGPIGALGAGKTGHSALGGAVAGAVGGPPKPPAALRGRDRPAAGAPTSRGSGQPRRHRAEITAPMLPPAESMPGGMDGQQAPVVVHSRLHAVLELPDGSVLAELIDDTVGRSDARS